MYWCVGGIYHMHGLCPQEPNPGSNQCNRKQTYEVLSTRSKPRLRGVILLHQIARNTRNFNS